MREGTNNAKGAAVFVPTARERGTPSTKIALHWVVRPNGYSNAS
jgi:hypothetical protein